MKNQLATALAITAKAFENKTDKAGKPYMLHCLRVMHKLHSDDEELNCIAVMHDLTEDTDWTIDMLASLGFSMRILTGLQLLHHDSKTPYQDYIKAMASNDDCVKVKKADLRDNSNITRLKGLTKKDFDRIEKYHIAYTYLSNV